MAKHKHRQQDSRINDSNTNNINNINNKSIPFGIDPMQLMGLLGGNFDMGNMLSSMNTNGFNLGNLGSLAQMMGLNLDNNFLQGNMNNTNSDINKNMHSNTSRSMKAYTNNTSSKNNTSSNVDKNNKKNTNDKNVNDKDENLDFLMALKSYAHPDRIQFIDKIIEAYKSGEFKDI